MKMRAFMLIIVISLLLLEFIPSSHPATDKWNKRILGCSGLFCCRKQSEPDALKNLMPKGGIKPTTLLITPNFIKVLDIEEFKVDGKVIAHQYRQSSAYRRPLLVLSKVTVW